MTTEREDQIAAVEREIVDLVMGDYRTNSFGELRDLCDRLRALQAPPVPSVEELQDWWLESDRPSVGKMRSLNMARILEWVVAHPDEDLPTCIDELRKRGGS